MSSDTRLVDFLVRYEDLRQQGQPITPEELCRDCPALLPELNRRIADLRLMDNMLHASTATDSPTWPPANLQEVDPATGPVIEATTRFQEPRFHDKGGLGEIWISRDVELGREVAVKLIQKQHARESDSVQRFLREAEITGRLEHPGIVPVHSLGRTNDGRPCYTMRFIQGKNLSEAIREFHAAEAARTGKERSSALEFRALLQRFVGVCNTIAYAHSRGIIHRDLKPQNIMLGKYGETLVVDWGLAKSFDRKDAQQSEMAGESTLAPTTVDGDVTRLGQAIGTPAYMSPEQAAGRWDIIGPPSDIYGLGATLYTVLAGAAPFRHSEIGPLLFAVQQGDFPAPRRQNPKVPPALEAICLKAMARKPQERYASALDLARDIERWLADEAASAYAEPLPVRAGRWARKHRTLATTAAAVLLVALIGLTAGLVIVTGLNRDLVETNANLDTARNQAEEERAIAQAVNDFLQDDLLAEAAPDKNARNKKVTVEEVLGRAAIRITGKFEKQPRIEAAIRLTIGNTYYKLGNYPAAQPHMERALEVRRRVLGEEHPDTLTAMNNLAELHQILGQFPKAEPLLVKTLEVRRRVLGEEHPDFLSSMNNLAALYWAQGQYTKAEPLYVKTLEGRRRVLGEEHSATLTSMNNLGLLYSAQGQLGKAEPLLVNALETCRRVMGEEHPDTLGSLGTLAGMYLAQRRYAKAEPLFVKTLEGRCRVLGEEHSATLGSMNNLAMLYQNLGQFPRAEPLLVKTLEVRRRVLGEEHPDTLGSMNNLAALYWAQGQYSRAEPLCVKALEVRRRVLGEEHPDTLNSMHSLASVRIAIKDYAAAEGLLVPCQVAVEKNPNVPPVLRQRVVENLVKLYDAWNKPDEAERWRAKLPPAGRIRDGLNRQHVWPLLWGWPRF